MKILAKIVPTIGQISNHQLNIFLMFVALFPSKTVWLFFVDTVTVYNIFIQLARFLDYQ